MKNGSIPVRFLILFLGIILDIPVINAQIFRDYYRQEVKINREAGVLSLSVNASTFFNNNEFFNTNVEGYTLTGAFLQPLINYSVTDKLSFGTGIHLMKYNGRADFAQVLPLFRIDYMVSDKFRVTMGSFNGGEIFRLPEPLYKFENHFTDLVNNGIRLEYRNSRIHSLTWLNWEHFILPGDTIQEQFTFGSSNSFLLVNHNRNMIRIPVAIVIHHQGGQINITESHVISKLNIGTGIYLSRSFADDKHGEVFFNPMFFYDGDDEDTPKGVAWYPQIGLNYNPFCLTAGYFLGNRFQSIHGEPLFFSPVRTPAEPNLTETRSLITFKAGIGRRITGSSSILLRFEGYYDTTVGELQYTYGLHIVLNEDFVLWKRGERVENRE